MALDRRHFAITAAGAPLAFAAAKAQVPPQEGAIGPSRSVPPLNGSEQVRQIVARLNVEPFAQPITFTRNRQTPKLQPFPLSEVRLTGGPFQDMHAWNAGYMKRLSSDSLLHTFRINAGIPSNATPLGGWEDPKGELRGHFVGHYLSACALGFASADASTSRTSTSGMGRTSRTPSRYHNDIKRRPWRQDADSTLSVPGDYF